MHLREDLTYDAAPGEVWAMLTDQGFQEQVCRHSGAQTWEVEIAELPGGRRRVISRQRMILDEVPDFARRFVGESVDIVRVDDWEPPRADGTAAASTVVTASGAPVRLKATVTLTGADGGTVQRIDGELRASVPLIGRRIELAAAPAIEAAMRHEHDTGVAWLAAG